MTESVVFHPSISAVSLKSEIERVSVGQRTLANRPVDHLIAFLDALGRALATQEFADVEGIAFLSTWLREKNLRKILEINFGPMSPALDGFQSSGKIHLRAVPRGIAAHWIAGNIPTLAIFSFALSLLCKNGNLIRVSKETADINARLFAKMRSLDGDLRTVAEQVMEATSIFYFPSSSMEMNSALSLSSDVRIIWGGPGTVEAILSLPRQEHTEDVIFGPKFSIVVVDREALTDDPVILDFARRIGKETVLFDQAACSSPQIVFVEGDLEAAQQVGKKIEIELKRLTSSSPHAVGEAAAMRILNARANYALSDDSDVLCSSSMDYTILIDQGSHLSDAIQSRSLFIRAVPTLMDVIPLLTPKIQTIGVCIKNESLKEAFCEQAARSGVARLVAPGLMNLFDVPWDGMRVLDRLVRWVVRSC